MTSADLVRTRFFTQFGIMAFDATRDDLLGHVERLRASVAGLENDARDDRYREHIVRAKTHLLGRLNDGWVFPQAAAVIHELVARQPGFNADTSWYFIAVDSGESMCFNAFGRHEKNQFDFHCQNLKTIFNPGKKKNRAHA